MHLSLSISMYIKISLRFMEIHQISQLFSTGVGYTLRAVCRGAYQPWLHHQPQSVEYWKLGSSWAPRGFLLRERYLCSLLWSRRAPRGLPQDHTLEGCKLIGFTPLQDFHPGNIPSCQLLEFPKCVAIISKSPAIMVLFHLELQCSQKCSKGDRWADCPFATLARRLMFLLQLLLLPLNHTRVAGIVRDASPPTGRVKGPFSAQLVHSKLVRSS